MRIIDDGKVAVSFETVVSVLRIHDAVPESDHPPFTGSGMLVSAGPGVVKIAGLAAEHVTRAHLRLLARGLLEEGFHTIVVDRAEGHRLPMARRIDCGPLAGWWSIDLLKVRLAKPF